jgi:Trk K+ transport system NAD-binding subunit
MVRMATDPSIVDLFDEGSAAARSVPVVERLVSRGSELDGRPIREVAEEVLAVRRTDGTMLARPDGDVELGVGDVVLLLAGSRAPGGG